MADEEIKFDFKKIINFFKKDLIKKYAFILLILIPLFLSFYFRMLPADLPMLDKYAYDSVMDDLKTGVSNQVMSESPNLPPETLQREVERRLGEEIRTNKDVINQEVKNRANAFKSRLQDDDGQTYLLGIDPYTYYRRARNIIDHGHVGDVLKDGKPYNTHMVAPIGTAERVSLHPYVIAYLYKILHPITGRSLMGVDFLVPVIISMLAVIPAFFIGRKVSGNMGGFVAALLIAIHSAFISRTAAGFADTDAYNVTLPLFATWFFVEAFINKDLKRKIIYSALCGLTIGIFSFAWVGWWYIFDFLVFSGILYVIYSFILNFKHHKFKFFNEKSFINTLIVILIFVISAGIFVSLFRGFDAFIQAPISPLSFITIKDVATESVWPNVYTTVAEQNAAPFPQVVNVIGGKFLFALCLIGILISLVKITKEKSNLIFNIVFVSFSVLWYLIIVALTPNNLFFIVLLTFPIIGMLLFNTITKNKEVNIMYGVLIFLWLLSTLYASRQGIRFSLLLVPAFSLGIGILFGRIYIFSSEWLTKSLGIPKIWNNILISLIILIMLISPVAAGWRQAKQEVPSMDDGWYEALTYIKENSQDDDYKDDKWNGAIINSWWDFGHWFKAIADRAVTFDGASQNTPMAHWIGKALLTDNENEAVGILRMLDCGSNNAFETLDEIINDSPKSVDILYDVIIKDRNAAKNVLKSNGLNDEQAEQVLELTHCDPPENFFITSGDMVGKSGVWAHFGSWDFHKASMYMNVKDKSKQEGTEFLTQEFGLDEKQATKVYYEIQSTEANDWIAPWPSYSQRINCQRTETTINCGAFLIDLATKDITMAQDIGSPYKIIYDSSSKIEEITINPDAKFSIAIFGNRGILMQNQLTNSMFTRMYFYQDQNLKHFDLVKETDMLSGEKIYVWKVDWQGSQ